MANVCYQVVYPGSVPWGSASRPADCSNLGSDPALGQDMTANILSNAKTFVNVPHTAINISPGVPNSVGNSGAGIVLDGTIPPSPPNVTLISDRQTVKSEDFESRKSAGEVVVNDYYTYSGSFEEAFIPSIVDTGPCNIMGRSTIDAHNTPFYRSRDKCGGIPFAGRSMWGYNTFYRRHGSFAGWRGSYDEQLNPTTLKNSFRDLYVISPDPDLMQRTLADANERSVDLLTALMEAPETILSIGEILLGIKRQIQRMIFRRNAWESSRDRLYTLFVGKERRIRAQIDYFTYMLANYNGKRVAGMRRKLNAQRRLLRRIQKEKKSAFKALNDQWSNAWLRFRYEIMPNLYLAQDLAESASKLTSVFQSSRNRVTSSFTAPSFSGWVFHGTAIVEHRAFTKYGFKAAGETLMDIRKAFSVNPFLTAWELGTLTFVLDWFFSVGNFLSARFGKPSLATSQGSVVSERYIIDGYYSHIDNGGRVTVSFTKYRRNVVNPSDLLGIFPLIDLNWKRLIDSSALLWSQLSRHFKLK